MGISARLSGYFSARIRSRGADYYSRGSVHLDEVSDTAVEATVWGSSEYYVILELQKNTLFGSCDCPYSVDYGACRHLWATLLAADEKGFLSNLNPGIQLRLELDEGEFDNPDRDFAADDELDEDDEEPMSGFDLPRGASRAKVRETPRTGTGKKAPLATWRSRLNMLVQGLSYTQPSEVSPWPPSREIGYIVDVSKSLANGGLCLEIAVRAPKQNGELS